MTKEKQKLLLIPHSLYSEVSPIVKAALDEARKKDPDPALLPGFPFFVLMFGLIVFVAGALAPDLGQKSRISLIAFGILLFVAGALTLRPRREAAPLPNDSNVETAVSYMEEVEMACGNGEKAWDLPVASIRSRCDNALAVLADNVMRLETARALLAEEQFRYYHDFERANFEKLHKACQKLGLLDHPYDRYFTSALSV